MPNCFHKTLLAAVAVLLSTVSQAAADEQPLRLTLPSEVYAVVGVEMNVYFDNVVLTETPEAFRFEVQCDVGQVEARRWKFTPTVNDIGSHSLLVSVTDSGGKDRGGKTTRLIVVPADAGADREVKLLIVGDSLTHATAYPNEIARLLSRDGNPKWKMLGTHRPSSAADGVAHEGYGGWTWQRFVTHYEPNPDGTYRKRSSPFVFLGKEGKPELNVARYFDENFNGERPDVVFFLLGINDCFGANPDDPMAIDERIDLMLKPAGILLEEFHNAAPDADLAICVTTPPNARESGFEANYKGRYHRWGWKRIQDRLVERLLAKYETKTTSPDDQPGQGQKHGHLFVVPTQLNIDPVDGYPENNGVHPNGFGYQQIGASIYSWLKWRLK
ncbi:MAG: SGNH/GDSL hydrolase family protein [Rhodopirellula sp.]|nr:SGNH/GDSL hydrolase family protein [Rhodopirellula sp.]